MKEKDINVSRDCTVYSRLNVIKSFSHNLQTWSRLSYVYDAVSSILQLTVQRTRGVSSKYYKVSYSINTVTKPRYCFDRDTLD